MLWQIEEGYLMLMLKSVPIPKTGCKPSGCEIGFYLATLSFLRVSTVPSHDRGLCNKVPLGDELATCR